MVQVWGCNFMNQSDNRNRKEEKAARTLERRALQGWETWHMMMLSSGRRSSPVGLFPEICASRLSTLA